MSVRRDYRRNAVHCGSDTSTFDREPQEHVKITNIVLENQRLVNVGMML
jgi:transcription termination factor Rho